MPGICGFLNNGPHPEASKLAGNMLGRLRTPACPIVSRRVDPAGRYALGRASLGILPTSPQPVSLQEGHLQAVMDGELYEMDNLCSGLRWCGQRVDLDDHAMALLAQYANAGTAAIAAVEGSFAAAIVDLKKETLTLISDRFGTRPLYYVHTKNRFLFASSISALLADPQVSRELNWQGVSQFFTFGHYFNDDTSLAAVKILPAATVLIFDAQANRVSLQRYWAGSQRIAETPASPERALEAVDDALVASVRTRQMSARARIGLSLSGGLDARTILGTLDHTRNNLATVCMGMRGSQDHQASTQLAKIVGCKHYNHILDTTFLGEFSRHLENMVRLTDGQYLSQCIVMPTLPLYRHLGIGILMRGHAGELMHMTKAYNYSIDAKAIKLRSEADLEHWLWNRLKAYILDGVEGPLFASREANQPQAARESLRQALSNTPCGASPVNRIAHLFLDQRVRRETMLSMMKFRSVTEPRLPYLDRTLVERLLAIPLEWRLGDELQTRILRKHQPRFCQVENTNTGAPLGAGKMRRSYCHFKMRVFGKLGVPGYQPYERLGLWLRRELAGVVRATLLSDACLSGGVFHTETVRRVVERHLSGQRNHTYLIMAMMIFEVGHRWLLDNEPIQDEQSEHHLAVAR